MSDKPEKTVTLTDNSTGKTAELPVLTPVLGVPAIAAGTLQKDFGHFFYDPGYVATASCSSKITYLDGAQGKLLYRGYPIEQLAEKCKYLEVCYLLLYGDLPTPAQFEQFEKDITTHTMINENLKDFFDGFRYNSHPMAMMTGVVGSLSAFYPDSMEISDPEQQDITAKRLVAKMPTLAAYCYKRNMGQPYMYPRNEMSYCGNFLQMMFGTPCMDYELDETAEKALDVLFILHADHEQNASTSTVRMAGSSGANPYTAIAAGVASLWGPAHGGANEAVLKQLMRIGSVKNIDKYIDKAKDRNDPFRLMGFGHRVYRNFDPRAKIIKKVCHEVLAKKGDDPLMELAMRLEEVALKDEYFIQRKLYPNVDFYSGIIYKALGIPLSMFTVMFAVGRAVGWISHWREMVQEDYKINRPRQLYMGEEHRDVVPLYDR